MSETLDRLQDQLTFGSGEFLGVLLNVQYDAFQSLSPREQALLVGYADGCPVTQRLTDPTNPDPARGPEKMIDRYGEVNFWFRQLVHAAEELNPQLAGTLIAPVMRREPVGENIEQESVPSTFYAEMSPLGTLWGYAASRLLVKQLGSDKLPQYESQRRLDQTVAILSRSVSEARSPEDLLALVAEGVAQTGDVDPMDILHEALSHGWYGEHHASDMVADVKEALRIKAPNLWGAYESLTEEDKRTAGILAETAPLKSAAGPISIEGLQAYHNEAFGYTLWEEVIDPANPEGPRGIVMHVPAGSISKVWELLEPDYEESVELLRGSGSFVFQRAGSEDWVTALLDAENPTADGIRIGQGDKFSVVADGEGIVIFSRPSKPFDISFERGVTESAEDALSKQILAQIALSRSIGE